MAYPPFPQLPQSVWGINTVVTNRVDANTSAPATPFDLTIVANENIQAVAINNTDYGVLYLFDSLSGQYKDTIYDFTRLNTVSPILLNCKRIIGEEINIGDKIVSAWGMYHIETLISHLGYLNSRNLKPPVVYAVDATVTVSECEHNLIMADTSTGFGAVELELPFAVETVDYDGLVIEFKCNGPNSLTIAPQSATIDGAINRVLLDDESLRMVYNYADNNFEVVS